MPTPTLSLLAREVLSLAIEKIAFRPSIDLWSACCHAADDLEVEGQRGLDELAKLQGSQEAPGPLARVFRLGGAEAIEETSHLLQTASFPVETTIPAPAPTVEVLSEDARLRAAGVLGQAHDSLEHARLLLGAAHEGEVLSIQNQIEALSRELLACFSFLPTAEAAE